MKTAIYIRVSKKDQTTFNQELELRKYCEREGLEVFKVYNEQGVGGSTTSRPMLNELLSDMRARRFQVLVCWKYDRLGRSAKHLLDILQETKNYKVRLIATSQNIDTSTSTGKLFYTIVAGFAEFEREIISERTLLGLERAKAEGKPIGLRGKDKKQRVKSGYFLRWERERRKCFA